MPEMASPLLLLHRSHFVIAEATNVYHNALCYDTHYQLLILLAGSPYR